MIGWFLLFFLSMHLRRHAVSKGHSAWYGALPVGLWLTGELGMLGIGMALGLDQIAIMVLSLAGAAIGGAASMMIVYTLAHRPVDLDDDWQTT